MEQAYNGGSFLVAVDLVAALHRKGVRLWTQHDELHYQAPKGVLSRQDLQRLKLHKSEIVSWLVQQKDAGTAYGGLEPDPSRESVPLTFSQSAHWHLYGLAHRPAIRQIASATHLQGRLHTDLLHRSLEAVVLRHEALRTRIVNRSGIPEQMIAEDADFDVTFEDLTGLSHAQRQLEIQAQIKQCILEPVELASDPLFAVRVLKLGDLEHVLILALEHMISDAVSMGLFLRDLFAIYREYLTGDSASLPTIPIQFPDYALWQQKSHESWMRRHGEYWRNRLPELKRLRFPETGSVAAENRHGWGAVALQVNIALKGRLQQWAQTHKTSMVMAVLTAYVALLSRWCDTRDVVIQCASDGRWNPKILDTIGYFASVLYVRVLVREEDSFLDLLHRVTDEYCAAYEHDDSFLAQAQASRPEFTRGPGFNWIHQHTARDSAPQNSKDVLVCSQIPFEHPMMDRHEVDNEPILQMYETEHEIRGEISFPRRRFDVVTLQRFSTELVGVVELLLNQPELPVCRMPVQPPGSYIAPRNNNTPLR